MFKIDLAPLGPIRAAWAFRTFFDMQPPPGLASLTNLTPGDFAAVRRQLRHAPASDADDLLERLAREGSWRPARARMGF